MDKLKIAVINATGGNVSGGYRTYLCNIIPGLAMHRNVESILCAAPQALSVQDWFNGNSNVRFTTCKTARFLGPVHDIGLLKELETYSPDVIFVPVARPFKFNNIPIINMVQNMESFTSAIEGTPISERFKQWLQSVDGKRAIKKAARVIAPSKFVADFLEHNLNISKKKIGLVHYGINKTVHEKGDRPDIIPLNWSNKFLFTAGSVRPARGLEDILIAMKNSCSGTEHLVVAGKSSGPEMNRYQRRLKDWARKNNLSDKICWAGGLNEKEMTWCYQNCKLFVMTSRVESFGMIAAEAMANGCICISADNPCLPEIFGDAAIYYQPKNGKDLANSIKKALSWDNSQRKKARERALKQASGFSWDVCVERTVAQLAKAAGSQG